jgi:hypothetical protein
VAELFDAVEDELETSLELARVVIARCPELFDHFDEVWEPAGEGWVGCGEVLPSRLGRRGDVAPGELDSISSTAHGWRCSASRIEIARFRIVALHSSPMGVSTSP